jgi:hypothetical protein
VQLVAAVVAVAALAAGILMYVRSDESAHDVERQPIASVVPPATTTASPAASPSTPTAVASAEPRPGVEVDEIESSSSHGVSVFEIPVAGTAAANVTQTSSVVIWIDDETSGGK